MKRLILSFVLLFAFSTSPIYDVDRGLEFQAAHAAVVNALDMPGSAGNLITMSAVGNARTQNSNSLAFGIIWNVDVLPTGVGAVLYQWKRGSNDAFNWGIYLDDGADRVCLGYWFADDICHAFTPSTDTWYLTAATYTLGSDTWRMDTYSVPAGTLVESDSFSTTTTDANDSATQEPSLGALEDGGSVSTILNGQLLDAWFIYGAAPSQSDIDDKATDPLNTGDTWVSTTFAGQVDAWWDSTITCPGSVCTGVSGNSETLTLSGGATLGSGNGPDIPTRSAGGSTLIMSRFRDGR